MKLAFAIFKYFPYGGMQRNFIRVLALCRQQGHEVRVYTLDWQGSIPQDLELIKVPVKALANHRLYEKFSRWMQADLQARPVGRVVGFNKMPGLDYYYAADPCFEHKARTLRSPWYRLGSRYRHFAKFERAVFSPNSHTRLLVISNDQVEQFQHYYQTQSDRFLMLPPAIARDRRAPSNAPLLRQEFRTRLGLRPEHFLVLQIGSDFKRKGLDRTLRAIASLPADLRGSVRLIAIGQDKPGAFLRSAMALGINEQVTILGGQDNIPEYLLAGDVLMHPAYSEATGNVLLEGVVAGLPVIATEVCGYAHYLLESGAGFVVPEPFSQEHLNSLLAQLVRSTEKRRVLSENGLRFADSHDLYSRPERMTDMILTGK